MTTEDTNHKIRELEQINMILKDMMKKEKHLNSTSQNPIESRIKELESAGEISEELLKKLETKVTFSKDEISDMNDKLRNPLVPIIGYTDMLISGKFGNLEPEQLKKIEHVNNNAKLLSERLYKMLNEM
ncbi:hypothetical protein [Nitrosopumilus sp.]|uniref:hypothetical protein n=1 Tax=Nitrosopumilus sp. TaxID=2024843 RepID=UPI00261135CD|nr:hypothetical protein [Nitrosopumilus sp.]